MTGGLIALDWGTSTLRAFLLGERGEQLDARTEPWGVMHVPDGDFEAAFDSVTGAWRSRAPHLRALASGMIGSTQGWAEAPYCPVPTGAGDLAKGLLPLRGGALYLVPGIASHGDAPDMMRGEETQVIGALALHPELAARSHFVLPGTHSKWIDVEDGRITAVRTFMTGELFSVLKGHSILGRPVRAGSNDCLPSPHRSFATGVQTARDGRHGLSPLLFVARAMVLANRIASDDAADFLSGLLIGDELRAGLSAEAHALVLVGDATLCGRYAEALEQFDVADPMIIGDAARAGLWTIGSMAGLVDQAVERPA